MQRLVSETVPFVAKLFPTAEAGRPFVPVNTYVHEGDGFRPMFNARDSADVVKGINDTRELLRTGKTREAGFAGYGLLGERVERPAWAV